MNYLALGDSYTIGEGVQPEERWPSLLADLLTKEEVYIKGVDIVATTGWTTGELRHDLTFAPPEPIYDICSLCIGVNNQYRGLSIRNYAVEFEALLSMAIRFAQGHVHRTCVVSIPDWGVSPFADGKDRTSIARQIDEFNKVNKAIAGQHGAPYVDITPLTRTLTQDHYFTEDGLHPSVAAYRLWVEEIRATWSLEC